MRRKVGTFCMILGAVLVAAALSLFLRNQWEEREAGIAVREVLPLVVEAAEGRQAETEGAADGETSAGGDTSDGTLPVVEIDGHGYIGYVTIPSLSIEMPVMDEWNYENLQIAACRYYGSVNTGDMVIAAHNYRDYFGTIQDISLGAEVYFTDMKGNVTAYTAAEVETLDPYEVEGMTGSGYPLTLFTCTPGGQNRVAVRCDLMG